MAKPSHDTQNGDAANRDGFGVLNRLISQGSGMLQRATSALKKNNRVTKERIANIKKKK